MSDLKALNNTQLHHKCLEYGLPNIPVTDSTRNVILRRLQKAMEAPKTTRRETLAHDTRQDNKEDGPSGSATRRRTVAAVAGKSPSRNQGHVLPVERETNRNSSLKPNTASAAPVQYKRNTLGRSALSRSNVMTTSQDQAIASPLNRVPRAPSVQDRSDTESQHSNMSSVSLSRSEVFTTSYTQEISPMRRQVLEEEYDDDDDDDDYYDELEAMDVDEYYDNNKTGKSVGGNHSGTFGYNPRISNQTSLNSTSYSSLDGPSSVPIINRHPMTTLPANSTSYNNYKITKTTTPNIQPPPIQTTTTKPFIRPLIQPYNSIGRKPTIFDTPPPMSGAMPTSSATKMSTPYAKATEPEIKRYSTPKSTQSINKNRYSAAAPVAPSPAVQSPKNILYPSLNDFYPETSTPNMSGSQFMSDTDAAMDYDESVVTESESEPEDGPVDPLKNEYSKFFKRRAERSMARRGVHDGAGKVDKVDEVRESVRSLFDTLQKKYQIKELFALLMCFILSVFIYSMFFAN